MFVGREHELKVLEERYKSGRFEFIPVYGRRRVGKTALIKEFIKDKRAIFFTAAESGKNHNLRSLSSIVYEFVTGTETDLIYNSFEAVFNIIYDIASEEKLIFVIDEYPYLAQSYKAISSILQRYIDQKFSETDIFIILCGSSMSFMEYQVLGYKSPLYGRRTGQMKIMPFGFEESIRFHGNFTIEEKAVIYGITGGVPKYLEMFADEQSLADNIIGNFLTAETMMFEEPSNLLKQELREPQTYNDIITAIAAGSSRMNEIVTRVNIDDFDSSKCNKYLSALISLAIVKKEQSILADSARKSIYRISDGMFRFWYRFIPRNLSRIQIGQGKAVYRSIERYISDFMGEVFEDICKQWMWREAANDRLPFIIQDCGRWWGTNQIRKAQQEIDLLAFDDEQKRAIFCECKWRNEKIDSKILDDLIEKAEMFAFETTYFYLFSKTGFTAELIKKAEEAGNICLVSFKDMYQ